VAGWRPLSSEITPEPDVPPYPDNARIHLDWELFESASFASERQLSMEFSLPPRHPFGMSIPRFGQNEHDKVDRGDAKVIVRFEARAIQCERERIGERPWFLASYGTIGQTHPSSMKAGAKSIKVFVAVGPG
jgi:hypothetical protein